MRQFALALIFLGLAACASAPAGAQQELSQGQAKAYVEEIVSIYAISAKDMHVSINVAGTVLRWQDQLHDAHNRMTWVPRKHTIHASDTLSGFSHEKNAVAMTLKGIDGEATFYAENEQRAQQLANALRSLIKASH